MEKHQIDLRHIHDLKNIFLHTKDHRKAEGCTVSKTTRLRKITNLIEREGREINSMHQGRKLPSHRKYFLLLWSGKIQYFHIATKLGIRLS